jgi:hypothetical protein
MRSRMPTTREAAAARATRPHVSPTSLPDAFAHLQHAAGNRAVAEMIDRSSSKPGQAYVTVDEPQDSPDAVHEALYLLPGDHRHGTRTYTDKGRTYTPYTRIDNDTSDLIRAGEQEHLDDARRAYDLFYGLILATLRAMAGRRFGPAATPSAAEALARAEFDKQLPPALSVSQPAYRAVWITVLRRVAETDQGPRRERLAQPRQRDDGHRGWQVGLSTGADGHHEDRLGGQ